ncbi:probable disease resistance protein At4g27220 isoform X1 [Durio zibethinus]|uniref:Probable disease resistance protein At4g27220 isoform X1 n=1 Tax=Durio zibethinus TaxID=66656 RepID=A0A6P5YVF4_DURZI|nr:probable disease resistance protein At4g27220 isoform X1 [Durio zibethinus]XP_022744215.1 probable disease resistance protein At4g27220 isoform X1 [Durio zibethinus]
MEFVIGIASSIVTIAAEYTIAPIKNQIKFLSNHEKSVQSLKDQVESLKDARERVRHSIDAAKRNGEEIEHDADKWLTTVNKKIDEEVERVIQDEEEAKKKCFLGLCPSFWTRYKHSMKAEEETKAVAELLGRGKFDPVSYRTAPEPPTSVKGFEAFESRRLVLNGIMEALNDATIKVIGVHGMGGVGKTTLVKEVARQVKEGQLFDSVVIATVTQTLDVEKIQNQIADLLGLKFEEPSMVGRALRLRERLNKEKKILVILDDIWASLDLEEVGIPFGNEHEGCKVLLTSRDLNVLSSGMDTQKNFLVGLLNEEEAWALFKKMAGDCVESCDLHPTAIEVAKKSARLPIAIATVARALRNKSLFEWKNALRELNRPSSGNFAGVTPAVYSAIELSYNYLESEEVKLTFLLCSLMGHDALIRDLVKYVIGLGCFQGVYTIKEARYKVLTVVSNLKASCLLLDSYNNEWFDIHDVVCAVAISIASRDHHMFVLRYGDVLKEWPDKERMNNCWAINVGSRIITELPDEMECSGLSFFCMSRNGSLKIPANFFRRTERLKVLDFTGMHFPSLPVSINLLTNLRTLCLDGCALEDISIIGKLKSLEILSFLQSDIKALPREIAQLTRLRLLDLSHCTTLKIIPPNVLSNLSNLEELYMEDCFVQWEEEVPGSERRNASLLEELKHLTHLTTLYVHIPNARIVPERLFTETLDRYRIFIGYYFGRSRPDAYEYSRTLKLKLYTSIYKDHGVKILLKKTEDLYLAQLKGIKNVLDELNNGEDFPYLKKLHIQDGLEVQYIAAEKMEFGQLQSMTLQDLPQLVSFTPEGRRYSTSQQEQEDTTTKPLFNKQIEFPELKSLRLSSIKTQRIWHNQLSNTRFSFPNLKSLIIQGCGNLEHLLLPCVARSLEQLQHFEIVECKCLREIIVTEEIEEGKKNVIRFSQLNSLKIRNLHNLIKFCSGNYDIEFPSLKVLNIEKCPKLKEFINETKMEVNYQSGVQALFNEKAAVPSLKRMKISHLRNVQMIFHNELLAGSFCKLEEMEVQYCHQLSAIFSSTAIGIFQCLEKLKVSYCDSLEQIFELGGLNIEKTLGVEYSQLKELDISWLPALKHVWNNDYFGIPSAFQNLRRVKAFYCWSLKNLFPVSIAKDLPQLEYLRISSCGVEELVSGGEILEQPIRFKFPQMSSLVLTNLNEFKWFYPGQHTIVWPILKTLMTDCSTLLKIVASERLISTQEVNANGQRDSTIRQQLFLVEEVTPKLEELRLQKLDEIAIMSDGQFPEDLFHQIKVFEVNCFTGRSASFPISFLQRLYKLENLVFKWFDFKNLICREGDVGEKPDAGRVLSGVGKLKLAYCKNVTHIWKKDLELGHIILPNLETLEVWWCDDLINFGSSSSSFQNLTTLQVEGCNMMMNLVPPSVAQNLVHLKEMRMARCNTMKEIVANSEGDEATYEITFRKLKYLELNCLKNLASFCPGNHTFKFPSLEELIVTGCPRLKVFCHGVLSTPQLQRVKESDHHNRERWAGDLNTTIQLLYTQKNVQNSEVGELNLQLPNLE